MVRAAAVESLGQSSEPSEATLSGLMLLLEDANDQVKVEVTKVLPNLAGATPAVIDGLVPTAYSKMTAIGFRSRRLGPGQARSRGRRRGRATAPRRPDRGSERPRAGHAINCQDPAARNGGGVRRRFDGCLRRRPYDGLGGLDERGRPSRTKPSPL